MSIKQQAQQGFAKAADYDAHRPSFPAKSVDNLLENLRLVGNSGATVVDLAAGTGKFTELLAKRPEKFRIIAIEPHADMRAVLEKKQLPGVEVMDGISHKMTLPNGSVDAVICAQAFHWFANKESLKEIHRVLQMHGTLGMIWNIEDYNAPRSHEAASSWEAKMQDYLLSLDDDTPRYRHEQWQKVFDDQSESTPLAVIFGSTPLFSLPLGKNEERWEVRLSKDKIWERLNTLSQISVQEGKEREDTVKLFRDAIDASDIQVDDKDEVAIHGGTPSVWTTKIPA